MDNSTLFAEGVCLDAVGGEGGISEWCGKGKGPSAVSIVRESKLRKSRFAGKGFVAFMPFLPLRNSFQRPHGISKMVGPFCGCCLSKLPSKNKTESRLLLLFPSRLVIHSSYASFLAVSRALALKRRGHPPPLTSSNVVTSHKRARGDTKILSAVLFTFV